MFSSFSARFSTLPGFLPWQMPMELLFSGKLSWVQEMNIADLAELMGKRLALKGSR